MCPDPQLLSVYFDGELPSPWKEKMDSHLANCRECRQKLDTYSRLSGNADGSADFQARMSARERIWKKIEEQFNIQAPEPELFPADSRSYRGGHYHTGFWGRRISVPLPAAAAALLIIAAAVLWTLQTRNQNDRPNLTVASEELWPSVMDEFDSPGMVPLTDLNGVLQYLGSRDSGDIVILRLPETRSFSSSGEPAIIRAADYSRRKH